MATPPPAITMDSIKNPEALRKTLMDMAMYQGGGVGSPASQAAAVDYARFASIPEPPAMPAVAVVREAEAVEPEPEPSDAGLAHSAEHLRNDRAAEERRRAMSDTIDAVFKLNVGVRVRSMEELLRLLRRQGAHWHDTLDKASDADRLARANQVARIVRHDNANGTLLLRFADNSESWFTHGSVQHVPQDTVGIEEIDRIRTEPVAAKELETVQNYLIEVFPRTFASAGATAGLFVADEITGRPDDYWRRYRDRVRAVTAADVRRVAQTYLHPDRLVVLAVGDVGAMLEGDPDHPAYTLEKLAPGGHVIRIPLPDPVTLVYPK